MIEGNQIRRVLLLGQVSPPIHGQAMMTAELARQAATWPGFEVRVVNALYASERADLGGFSLGKLWRWMCYLSRVAWHCSAGRVSLVVMTHSFFRGPFLKDSAFVWLVRFLLRRKIIVWVHMDPSRLGFGTLPGWFRSHAERTLRRADGWVACAPRLLETWPAEFPRPKLSAVCNGIQDPSAGRLARPGQGRRIVFLSSMTEEKGWRELFRVAEELCGESSDWVFDFHGGPGAGETAESLAAHFAAGLFPERVKWHGPVWGEEKQHAMAEADLFCFPSWTEAFPLAVLEAMAFGLPVIASDVGGVADALVAGEGGWLLRPRDETAMASALREAFGNPSRLSAMGAANRERFERRFSDKAFGDSWRDLICRVLDAA